MALADIESELEKHGIKRQAILHKLWSLLQTLSGFPVGDFLLQKSSKLTDCIKVYQKKDPRYACQRINLFKFEKLHFR